MNRTGKRNLTRYAQGWISGFVRGVVRKMALNLDLRHG